MSTNPRLRDYARRLVADWPALTDAQRDTIRGAAAEVNHHRDRHKPKPVTTPSERAA